MQNSLPEDRSDISISGLLDICIKRRNDSSRSVQRCQVLHADAFSATLNTLPDQNLRLARVNPHPRDDRISFVEASHTYYLDVSRQFPLSVTAVWEKFFKPFDTWSIIEKNFGMWSKKEKSKYYPIILQGRRDRKTDLEIQESIVALWRESRLLGTHMHRQIELFLNAQDCDDSTVEMRQFMDFLRLWLVPRGWVPFRTEWSIYNETLKVAGQIDAVFKDGSGSLHMIDWKRVEDMGRVTEMCECGYGPCSFLADIKQNHYVAQQNLYATILFDCYGIHLSSMWLLQLHEKRESYNIMEVPFYYDMARAMLQQVCSGAVFIDGGLPSSLDNILHSRNATSSVDASICLDDVSGMPISLSNAAYARKRMRERSSSPGDAVCRELSVLE